MNGIIYFIVGFIFGAAIMVRFPLLPAVLSNAVSGTKSAVKEQLEQEKKQVQEQPKPIPNIDPYKLVDITKEIPYKHM